MATSRPVVLILGGGTFAESTVHQAVDGGSTVVYGHTSPLQNIKESTLLTPYPLDAGSYDSHLSVWQGVINRHGRIDTVIYLLDDVHALIKSVKIGIYHLRRLNNPGKRAVFLSKKGHTPLELAFGNTVIGMYRSLLIKFSLISVRSDLVCCFTNSNEDLVVKALLGVAGTYKEDKAAKNHITTSLNSDDTVYVINEGSDEISLQSPAAGQTLVGPYEALGKRLAGVMFLQSLVANAVIRHQRLAKGLGMTSSELNKTFSRVLVGVCAVLCVGGGLGRWGGLIAGWGAVMAL